jgi:hypothetical protein
MDALHFFYNPLRDARVSEKQSAELYRQKGTNSRSVGLTVKPDGSVFMETQDMGEQ